MMRRLACLALLLVAACSGDSTSPAHPGHLALTLTTAGTSDGAIVLVVSGGPVLDVTAPGAYQVASSAAPDGTHIMIVGDLSSGLLATIGVPDLSHAPAYVVTVQQVADRNSFGLLDPARDQVTSAPVQ